MVRGFLLAIGALRAVFFSQADLVLKNLALRQQLAAFVRTGGIRRRGPRTLDPADEAVIPKIQSALFRQYTAGRLLRSGDQKSRAVALRFFR